MKFFAFLLILVSSSLFASPVDINTADAQTIADALNGIGLKKAQVIVDYRAKNGFFKSVDELNNVPGIGDKIFEQIKDDITLSNQAVSSTPATETIPSDKKK